MSGLQYTKPSYLDNITGDDEKKALAEQQAKDVHALREYDAQQRRAVYLNETVKDRMRMQNEMLWAVFWVIAASAAMAVLRSFLPETFFPHTLYMVLELSAIALGALFVYVKYQDYRRRDAVRFDEIQLVGPEGAGQSAQNTEDAQKAKRTSAALRGDLSGSVALKQCVGAECCGPDTSGLVFDTVAGRCKPK